jgi:hypothetical protein
MSANATILAVTDRIRERSKPTRELYLARVAAAASNKPNRATLGCANLATSASSPPTTTCSRRISPSRPIRR